MGHSRTLISIVLTNTIGKIANGRTQTGSSGDRSYQLYHTSAQ